jgi:hypothetical protein
MQQNLLVLTPRDAQAKLPDVNDILAALQDIKLVGQGFAWHDEWHYLPGERFLELITFLGCSPAINIEPSGDDSEFCHVAIVRDEKPRVFYADNARTPRCLLCKQELTDWRDWCDSPKGEHVCPHCGGSVQLDALNWRRTVAIAQGAIIIHGVHDSEAVPAEPLLLALEKATGTRWTYGYQQYR